MVCFHARAWGIRSSTAADAFFSSNSATLVHEASIKKLHFVVQREAWRHLEVVIAVGHADATERNPAKLSLARAAEIKRLLVEMGMQSERIHIEGKGARQPVSNAPKENRRVEIEAIGLVPRQFPQYKLTWRMLLPESVQYQIPKHLMAPERAAMPVIDFVQALDNPKLRLIFANALLNEGIWRQDDFLATQAHAERQIALAILQSNKDFWDTRENAALEAIVYGTPHAKHLMQSEFELIGPDDSRRYEVLKRLVCETRPYPELKLPAIQAAGALLYPPENFAGKFAGAVQHELLNCGFERVDGVFEWLVVNGANPDTTNNLGQTFLHLDISSYGGERVALLLRHGANPRAVDYLGNTVLHTIDKAYIRPSHAMFPGRYLAKLEKQKLLDILTAAGANPNQPNKAGQLPVKP